MVAEGGGRERIQARSTGEDGAGGRGRRREDGGGVERAVGSGGDGGGGQEMGREDGGDSGRWEVEDSNHNNHDKVGGPGISPG